MKLKQTFSIITLILLISQPFTILAFSSIPQQYEPCSKGKKQYSRDAPQLQRDTTPAYTIDTSNNSEIVIPPRETNFNLNTSTGNKHLKNPSTSHLKADASTTTFYVEAGAQENGTSSGAPAGNITYVLNNYNLTNSSINVRDGIYNDTIEDFPLNLTEYTNLTLVSTGSPVDTILNGTRGGENVIKVSTQNVTLNGFTIRNGEAGILLENASDCLIKDNRISNNTINGLFLAEASDNNTVQGNNFTRNERYGVNLYSGENNELMDNFVQENEVGLKVSSSFNNITSNNISNSLRGIVIAGDNNNVTENDIEGGERGLHLLKATHTLVSGNKFNDNTMGFMVEGDEMKEYNHTFKSNTVNGKGAYYLFNRDNETIRDNTTTHLTIAYCENLTLNSSEISDGDFLRLVQTENTTLTKNKIKGNIYGVRIENSQNITLRKNNITQNEHGLSLSSLNDIMIKHNNIVENEKYGISTDKIGNTEIIMNDFSQNSSIYLRQSIDTTILKNEFQDIHYSIKTKECQNITIKNCSLLLSSEDKLSKNFYGIHLHSSLNNQLVNNTITGAEYGIFLTRSNKSTIKENKIINTREYGIYLQESEVNSLGKNKLSLLERGVQLKLSHNNTFTNNHIALNETTDNSFGFYFSFSHNNTLVNNTFTPAPSTAIYMSFSKRNEMKANKITGLQEGILLYHSNGIQLIRNNILSNEYAISLYNSQGDKIVNNKIRNTKGGSGLYLDHSDNVIIKENKIRNNTGYGIYITYATSGYITDNEISDNKKDGIHLSFVRSLDILDNKIEANGVDGIFLYRSFGNEIIGNKIIENDRYGLTLHYSNNNLITQNEFRENTKAAINEKESSGNTIKENEIPQKEDFIRGNLTLITLAILTIGGAGIIAYILLSRHSEEEHSS